MTTLESQDLSIGGPRSPRDADTAIALARIPDGTTRVVEVSVLAPTVMFAFLLVKLNTEGWLNLLSFAGVCVAFGTFLYSAFVALRLRTIGDATLNLETRGLHIRGPDGRSHLAVAYDQILSIESYTWPLRRLMLYTSGRAPLVFPDSLFACPEDRAHLSAAIEARISALPDGPDRLLRLRTRAQLAAALVRQPPWLTLVIACVLALVFVVQVWVGATTGDGVVILGASSGRLLLEGEILRLLTPALLHGHLPHLAANAIGILLVGGLLQGLVGGARVSIIFGLGSVAGMLASALWNPDVISLGASAGAYALLGALLVMNVNRRAELPGALRFTGAVAVTLAGSILLVELWWWDQIDHPAHLGGLLAGAGLQGLMARGRALSALLPPPAIVNRAAWLVGVSYMLAVAKVLHAAWTIGPQT